VIVEKRTGLVARETSAKQVAPEQVAPEFPSSSSSFPFFLHVPLNTAHQALRIIGFLGEQHGFLGEQHWHGRTQCGVSLNEQF